MLNRGTSLGRKLLPLEDWECGGLCHVVVRVFNELSVCLTLLSCMRQRQQVW
jgi:hypothetical protein